MPPPSGSRFDDDYPLFDRCGFRIGMPQFLVLRADPAYRCVEVECLGRVQIETIWLGCNEGSVEYPGLFETSIREGERVTHRYLHATIVEAVEGHDRAVGEVRRRLRTAAWRELQRVPPDVTDLQCGA